MARKTASITIAEDGRDKGKVFFITEMSASQGEAWAMRVLMALFAANVELPDNFQNLGMAALAQMGFKAIGQLHWEVAKPLLDEMFQCVQRTVVPRDPATTRPLQDSQDGPIGGGDYDIDEISTRIKLRMEVWKLHMGFLQAALPSLQERAKAAGKRSHTGT